MKFLYKITMKMNTSDIALRIYLKKYFSQGSLHEEISISNTH